MSKERLEDKIVEFRQLLALGHVNMVVLNKAHEIHELVIEQAERVQELEDIIYQDKRQAVLEGLYEQNNRYREALEFIGNHADESELMDNVMYTKLVKEVIDKALEG